MFARPGGAAIFDPARSVLQWPDEVELSSEASSFSEVFNASGAPDAEVPGQLVVLEGVETRVAEGDFLGAAVVVGPSENAPAQVAFPSTTAEPVVVQLPDGFSPEQATAATDAVVMVDDDRWVLATRTGVNAVSYTHLTLPTIYSV